MEKKTNAVTSLKITLKQIAQCIAVLEGLKADKDQIFNSHKEVVLRY